jgi:MFS family permease
MVILYLVNFLTAISTTVGMTLIPLIATQTLGMSLLFLGIMEGVSELAANGLKLYSGVIFDKIKNKKVLFVLSTFIAFLAKVALLFGGVSWVVQSKFLERFANGLFSTPRDSFVSLYSKNIGKSLSLMVSFKTLGCVLGGLLVSIIANRYGLSENIPHVLKLTCIFSLVAFVLSLFIKNYRQTGEKKAVIKTTKTSKSFVFYLTNTNPHIFILPILFFAARFNDGLIIIYLKHMNYSEAFYTSTISIFNFSMFIVSPFIGYLIYKNKLNFIVFFTMASLLIFNIIFFLLPSGNVPLASLGLVFWGIQRTSAAILFVSIIVKNMPKNLYGSAIGFNSITTGLSFLVCASISGYLAKYNFSYVFLFSGTLCITSLLYFVYVNITKRLNL